ncbi:MAG: FHA domain-containing protein, partial [Anaerolineae bacterium]|nr:FHA domain-containing protein [Anaerolineae bacterium]
IEGETRSLVFKALEIEELVLGRSDPKTGDKPEVDLTDYGAMNKGVSRKHAVIQRKDGSLYIIDQKSANGTYLNGQKLFEFQERVLRDSDDVRLGHLTIRVTLEDQKS